MVISARTFITIRSHCMHSIDKDYCCRQSGVIRVLATTTSPAKTDELTEMMSSVGPKNHVLDGIHSPQLKGHF